MIIRAGSLLSLTLLLHNAGGNFSGSYLRVQCVHYRNSCPGLLYIAQLSAVAAGSNRNYNYAIIQLFVYSHHVCFFVWPRKSSNNVRKEFLISKHFSMKAQATAKLYTYKIIPIATNLCEVYRVRTLNLHDCTYCIEQYCSCYRPLINA